jgi:catechol 2,3-dioxygenase-like lactoylglutathione lyase family enzyme
MKRFHVHVGVDDLQASVGFYSTLFGQAPTVAKDDYAKWMLDDPRVNFAISTRSEKTGLDHLGIQVDTEQELDGLQSRLAAAELPVASQSETTCCYSRSDKHWTVDPQNIAWEAFHTLGDAPTFSDKVVDRSTPEATIEAKGCCIPLAPDKNASACCVPTRGSSCCA